uniref:Calponin-homology (CH) domain-containing protein n=1 Tax=Plectus sambesii TaxID=2011161 RepID=A0A914WK31_9BILA
MVCQCVDGGHERSASAAVDVRAELCVSAADAAVIPSARVVPKRSTNRRRAGRSVDVSFSAPSARHHRPIRSLFAVSYRFNRFSFHLSWQILVLVVNLGRLCYTKMTERAAKSGFAREAQQKIHSKFDPELAGQILRWIESTSGVSFNTSSDIDNFTEVLRDGTVLCALANGLSPGEIKKVNSSTMAFKQMENISFFLAFADKHVPKNELFQTVDLYERQ